MTAIPWCTWYGSRAVALHKKRTHHGQPRSIMVCCGQSKMPTMQRQFAKAQVGKSGLVIARFFAKVRVAGSNPVVRSKNRRSGTHFDSPSFSSAHQLPIACPSRRMTLTPIRRGSSELHLEKVRFSRAADEEIGFRRSSGRLITQPADEGFSRGTVPCAERPREPQRRRYLRPGRRGHRRSGWSTFSHG
jgi:hypothetical protein